MNGRGPSLDELFEYTPQYDPVLVDFTEQHPLIRYIRYSALVRGGHTEGNNDTELATAWSDLKRVVARMVSGDYPPTMVQTMPAYLMSVAFYLVGNSKSYGAVDTSRNMHEWLEYVLNDSQMSWCSPVECPIVRLTVSAIRDETPPLINLYPDACRTLHHLWEYRNYVYYHDTMQFSRWAETQPSKTQILSFSLLSVLDLWQAEYSRRKNETVQVLGRKNGYRK